MHQMHEGQPAMLQGDQAGKSDGDSEAVTQFKNKLTEKVGVAVSVWVMVGFTFWGAMVVLHWSEAWVP